MPDFYFILFLKRLDADARFLVTNFHIDMLKR
jgi:hypothetical protein